MKTTITIDARMINSSGIGTYLKNLVPKVIDLLPSLNFRLVGNANILRTSLQLTRANIQYVECNAPIYTIKEQYELFKLRDESALFWSPHYNIPLLGCSKLLVTVHDVFHLANPESVRGVHKRLYSKLMFDALRRRACKIMCDSQFTADELVRFTKVDKGKIEIIHLGVDTEWFTNEKEERPHERPYLLFVGNVKPHKNLVRLVEAFETIAGKIPLDLIIIGKKEGFITGDKIVESQAARLGNRVLFTGHVTEEALRQYFMHADALVFPSLYEGFGLPPLEAMACGCPVIVSRTASLPEVCGDAVLYCEPLDSTDIADKILLLIGDRVLQNALREKGINKSRQFTWHKCASETSRVIEKLLSGE